VNYGLQSSQLTEIRELVPDQAAWSFSSQQATLRQLNGAFESFFRRVELGVTPGYPRFKSADRFVSVLWPKNGDGAKWISETGRVYLRGIGHVKVTQHRQVEGRVKTIQVKREGRRWYLILSCDDVPMKPLGRTDAVVGIDVGLVNFLTTSDGEHVANPHYAEVGAKRLASAQRSLSRKQQGSNNVMTARETVATRHRKIANQRRDFHFKIAKRLVEEYDALVVEDLAVKNMTKRAKPRADPENLGQFLPNGGIAKSRLNRCMNDAGWAQFRSILEAKAEEAGRTVLSVNPRHTSQRCHECGHVGARNRVSQAEFRCRRCGHGANADVNAARNILRAGLALQVA
jgi:putative transposase